MLKTIIGKLERKKIMAWTLMWLNWSVATINVILQLIYIYIYIDMVVKITIWIVGLHDFTIPPHQNVQDRIRIVKMVGLYVRSCKIVGSYGILPILPKT